MQPDSELPYGLNPNGLYTRKETASTCRCSVSKLDKEAAEGRGMPYIKRGNQRLYRGFDIIAELDSCLVQVA